MSLVEKVLGAVCAPKREAISLAQKQVAALNAAIETATSEIAAIEAKRSELAALEAALTEQLRGLNLVSTVVQTTVEAQLLATLGVANETAPAMARTRESKDSLIDRVASELDATHKSVKLLSEKLDKAPAQVAGALDALVLAGKASKVKQEGSRAFLYFKA